MLALVLVVAACGGDDDSADDGGDTATTAAAGAGGDTATTAAALDEPVTLRVLVHSQEPMTTFVQDFSRDFEAANPGVTVDVAVVGASDLATVTQTRLSANDVDVIDMFGFANPVQPYMGGATPPAWQTLIEAGTAARHHRRAVGPELRRSLDRAGRYVQRSGVLGQPGPHRLRRHVRQR